MKREIDNKKRFSNKKLSKRHLKSSSRGINKVAFLKEKADKKNQKNQKSQSFYYSFLTIVLLIFLAQVAFSAILNITKVIAYQTKIATIKKSQIEAETKNRQLKKELKYFSSAESLEAIARNNLKMAGNDEVLIIINEIKKQSNEETQSNKKIGILKKLGKHDKQ